MGKHWLRKFSPGRLALGMVVSGLAIFFVPWDAVGRQPLIRPADAAHARRIVSLAPNITETLFALGAGDRVVGVTTYCQTPPEAQTRTRVGGYYDPNYEAIVRLAPDCVILLPEHRQQRARLQDLGIPTLTVEFNSVGGVLGAFIQLGAWLQHEAQGAQLALRLVEALDEAQFRTRGLARPRVLLVINRGSGEGLGDLYIAGHDAFYDRLLETAGGQNAYTRPEPAYPKLSAEGLLRLDPDMIIELVPDSVQGPEAGLHWREAWNHMPHLRAVRQQRIYRLSGTHLVIPGPRTPLLLADLLRAMHPEAVEP